MDTAVDWVVYEQIAHVPKEALARFPNSRVVMVCNDMAAMVGAAPPDEGLAGGLIAGLKITAVAIVAHAVFGMARVLASTPRITALADGSTAYPAVQNLLLAARALGLGAVLTTPQFFVPGQFEALLDLPSDFTLAAVIPVGYPMGKFGKVKRPGAEEVVSWERYEG